MILQSEFSILMFFNLLNLFLLEILLIFVYRGTK